MKQKQEFVDSESTRKNLEHSLTYGNIETEKREPGGGRFDGLPNNDHRPKIQTGPMQPGSIVFQPGTLGVLYGRIHTLIGTVLDAVKQKPGDYNANAIEELSFQWHRGRLRAEREHGTPE